jgi:hypothetical protein
VDEVFEFKCFIRLRTMAKTALVLQTFLIFLVYWILSVCGDRHDEEDSKELPAFVTRDIVQEWNKWKVDNSGNNCKPSLSFNFQKQFDPKANSSGTEGIRKLINFAKTLMKLRNHNRKFQNRKVSFLLKLNSRAALSHEQKASRMHGLRNISDEPFLNSIRSRTDIDSLELLSGAPDNLDYRKLGYVTQVQDQGKLITSRFNLNDQISLRLQLFKLLRILGLGCRRRSNLQEVSKIAEAFGTKHR